MDEPTPAPEGYYPPQDQPDPFAPQKKPSSLPLIAGILLILAGLSGFLTWSTFIAADTTLYQNLLPPDSLISPQQLQSFLQTCSIIGVVLSAITLIGGIMAFRRHSWGIAMAGSVLGLFTIGIFFSASAFSLISLALLLIARKEFH